MSLTDQCPVRRIQSNIFGNTSMPLNMIYIYIYIYIYTFKYDIYIYISYTKYV
jgi:hypothetical protein